MKTIGLLGGMSWESSIEYERMINELVRERLGGNHSADLAIRSYDFHRIEALQRAGKWDAAGALLAGDARRLEDMGARVIVLCTNTMHRIAAHIEAALDEASFVHLADATARAVVASDVAVVGLLGTRYTMEQDFYRGRLESHGLQVLIPEEPGRAVIHNVIYDELVRGVVSAELRAAYLDAIAALVDRGAEGVIAGCTEIELLVRRDDVTVPYFATAELHARAAVDAALG